MPVCSFQLYFSIKKLAVEYSKIYHWQPYFAHVFIVRGMLFLARNPMASIIWETLHEPDSYLMMVSPLAWLHSYHVSSSKSFRTLKVGYVEIGNVCGAVWGSGSFFLEREIHRALRRNRSAPLASDRHQRSSNIYIYIYTFNKGSFRFRGRQKIIWGDYSSNHGIDFFLYTSKHFLKPIFISPLNRKWEWKEQKVRKKYVRAN